MGNIEKIREGLFVQRKRNGAYKMVYPIKKDLNKPFSLKNNIHWFNFLTGGSWWNVIIVILILLLALSYAHDTKECRELLENPPVCSNEYGFNSKIKIDDNVKYNLSLPASDNA